jgi:hypothetical protein
VRLRASEAVGNGGHMLWCISAPEGIDVKCGVLAPSGQVHESVWNRMNNPDIHCACGRETPRLDRRAARAILFSCAENRPIHTANPPRVWKKQANCFHRELSNRFA